MSKTSLFESWFSLNYFCPLSPNSLPDGLGHTGRVGSQACMILLGQSEVSSIPAGTNIGIGAGDSCALASLALVGVMALAG